MPRFVTLMMGLSKLAFRQSRKTGGRKSVTLGSYCARKSLFVKSFSCLYGGIEELEAYANRPLD